MHFILFQNSFQVAFFAWSWYNFGLRSCFHTKTRHCHKIYLRSGRSHPLWLCDIASLRLGYTEMGTSMKKAVFPEEVENGLKKWRIKAKKNLARRNSISAPPFARRNTFSAPPSLNTSLHSASPSAATLSTSFSLETYNQEDGGTDWKEHEKLGSFEFRDFDK